MFDYFLKEKLDFLKKKDKSKKGHLDKDIVKIIDSINSINDYYTTSSCAGRIVLLEMKSRKKNQCNWILSKHDKVKFNEIANSLKKYKNQIWFKQEPIILHVRCRNINSAKRLLDASRKIFKRAGIISLSYKKIVVEIIGTERIDTIVAGKGFTADRNYLKNLIEYANKNFVENKRKSKRFLEIIRKTRENLFNM